MKFAIKLYFELITVGGHVNILIQNLFEWEALKLISTNVYCARIHLDMPSKSTKIDNDKLNELLEKLAKESSFIVSSPETISQLKARGVKFDTPKPVTKGEYLDELFSSRRKVADSMIEELPPSPQ